MILVRPGRDRPAIKPMVVKLFELPPRDANLSAEQCGCTRYRLEHRSAARFLKEFAGPRPPIKFDIRKALRPGGLANGVQRLHAEDHLLGAAVGCPDVSGLGLDLAQPQSWKKSFQLPVWDMIFERFTQPSDLEIRPYVTTPHDTKTAHAVLERGKRAVWQSRPQQVVTGIKSSQTFVLASRPECRWRITVDGEKSRGELVHGSGQCTTGIPPSSVIAR